MKKKCYHLFITSLLLLLGGSVAYSQILSPPGEREAKMGAALKLFDKMATPTPKDAIAGIRYLTVIAKTMKEAPPDLQSAVAKHLGVHAAVNILTDKLVGIGIDALTENLQSKGIVGPEGARITKLWLLMAKNAVKLDYKGAGIDAFFVTYGSWQETEQEFDKFDKSLEYMPKEALEYAMKDPNFRFWYEIQRAKNYTKIAGEKILRNIIDRLNVFSIFDARATYKIVSTEVARYPHITTKAPAGGKANELDATGSVAFLQSNFNVLESTLASPNFSDNFSAGLGNWSHSNAYTTSAFGPLTSPDGSVFGAIHTGLGDPANPTFAIRGILMS